MAIQLGVPASAGTQPRIAVIGIGGGGCNALNTMAAQGIPNVEFIAADTDTQHLSYSRADTRIALGGEQMGGFGAGTDPVIGRKAAETSINEIREVLDGVAMAFLATGMGGGTGTGAMPVFARVGRELGILTVGVVTKPFEYEGPARMATAVRGIEESAADMDTLLEIANQNLFADARTAPRFQDALARVDDVLLDAVRGVIDLIVRPGIINLDFADLKMFLSAGGAAVIGSGEAEGENRGVAAAEAAANNPLLDGTTMDGAQSLLINVSGGSDLGLEDIHSAARFLGGRASPRARVKVGASSDPALESRVRVYVVATGVERRPANGLGTAYATRIGRAPRGAHAVAQANGQANGNGHAPPRSSVILEAGDGQPGVAPTRQPVANGATGGLSNGHAMVETADRKRDTKAPTKFPGGGARLAPPASSGSIPAGESIQDGEDPSRDDDVFAFTTDPGKSFRNGNGAMSPQPGANGNGTLENAGSSTRRAPYLVPGSSNGDAGETSREIRPRIPKVSVKLGRGAIGKNPVSAAADPGSRGRATTETGRGLLSRMLSSR